MLVATGFAALAAFQVSLALGAPLGAAAWGGTAEGQLSADLRVASSCAAIFWLLAAMIALARGGFAASRIPYSFSGRAMWVLTALLTMGTALNAGSQSRWERFGWAPFVLGLSIVSLQLARSGPRDSGPSAPHDAPRPTDVPPIAARLATGAGSVTHVIKDA
jgi:hypothetical protein